jgi:hypothetical protein
VKKYKVHLLIYSLVLAVHQSVQANESWIKGHLSTKIGHYLERVSSPRGLNFFASAETEKKLSESFQFKLQGRWKYQSLYEDLQAYSSDQKNTKELYWGETYIQNKSSHYVLTLGYQEVSWGESFGFNYADLVNPKDNKMTLYSSSSEAKIPLLMANFKFFFQDGSLQLIYSPEPIFNKSLPISLFTTNLFPNLSVRSNAEQKPDLFEENEFGGKLSYSVSGFDVSAFYFDYLNREAHYSIQSLNATTLTLNENHARVKSLGISASTTINEAYVLRSDLVLHKDKLYNQSTGTSLTSVKRSSMDGVFSLDTPTFSQFSFAFIGAFSLLEEKLTSGFRSKDQIFSIVKVSYDFLEDKILDLSYTHQFNENGHSLQGQFTHPITGNFEYKIGLETYWGEKTSPLFQVKKINNVFVGLKNYF